MATSSLTQSRSILNTKHLSCIQDLNGSFPRCVWGIVIFPAQVVWMELSVHQRFNLLWDVMLCCLVEI